jgi:ParB-like chromosome segregation protein Spo0J
MRPRRLPRTIPAIIRELTDEQAFDFMLIENLQRMT